MPESLRIVADDGVALGATLWSAHRAQAAPDRPVTVVLGATSVHSRYYARFAAHLFAHGRDVLTCDYRGIGLSRPTRWRGFDASWSDWGARDAEAVLAWALAHFPGRPLDVVAHSFGGCAVGLAPSARHVRRIVTVGAQYAYWRDYARATRWRMVLRWHVAMPLLAALFGHVPARRLGWMEDTPRGVAFDWAWPGARFEQRPSARGVPPTFAAVRAPVLAIALDDDPFGTVPAIDRLLAYFTGTRPLHWRVAPADVGAAEVGHFAFFHDRYTPTLWPLARAWLDTGALPADAPGRPAPTRLPRSA